ncbi:MAG: hypothetical protein WD491_07965 [Balneolales bacterium]
MPDAAPVLGICFSGKRLLFAVANPDTAGELLQIGCIDYSFDVHEAFVSHDSEMYSGVCDAISQLKKEYEFQEVRLLTLPEQECWTTLPQTVYNEQDDRDAYLNMLTQGFQTKPADPVWFTVSNRDYKLATIRSQSYINSLDRLTVNVGKACYYSDFEVGSRWIDHSNSTGSFLTVSCHKSVISISSFILGKLRSATYIKFDDINDLPYFWLQNAGNLSWLNGLYDQILIYGYESYQVLKVLQPFWEDSAEIVKMDTLGKMQVEAREETYSFNLEEAFPAIMLAIGKNNQD